MEGKSIIYFLKNRNLAEIQDKMRTACIKSFNKVYTSSNDIKEILNSLKPTKLNKNNRVISNEYIDKIKNYIEEVKDYC